MFIRKQALSVEQQHEVAGRCFNKEYQVSLAKYYGVSQRTICTTVQRYDKDAELKVQALAAASLFYDRYPDKRPDEARSSTHPAYSGGRNVMQAIQLPQQVPAFTSSFTVPPGISMQPADLNVPGVRVFPSGKAMALSTPPAELIGTGAIRCVFPPGQAFTSRLAWTVLHAQPHQAPALPYVHAGQETLLACTSQRQSEFHRPGASHSPVNGNPCVAPPNSAAAGQGSLGHRCGLGPTSTGEQLYSLPVSSTVQAASGSLHACPSEVRPPYGNSAQIIPQADSNLCNEPGTVADLDGIAVLDQDDLQSQPNPESGPSPRLSPMNDSNIQLGCPKIPSMSELYHLQRAVSHNVPKNYTNCEGVSGTIRPSPLADLVVEGQKAICEVHGERDVRLIDLGCGPGHVLWCAVLSGLFKGVIGVDLPSNTDFINNAITAFLAQARNHPQLKEYVKLFQEVQFEWFICNETNAGQLTDVLTVGMRECSMVYWFCTGWSAEDILQTAEVISQIPSVLGVVCLPRDMGKGACDLLDALNSSPENKLFSVHSKNSGVPMSGKGTHTAYTFVRYRQFEFEKNSQLLPLRGQSVQVLFKEPFQWFSGEVTNIDATNNKVRIRFDDATIEWYPHDDTDVFYLPNRRNQWRQVGEVIEPSMLEAQCCSFCTLCSEAMSESSRWCCARCCKNAYHLKCLGVADHGEKVCPICRAELAEIGRSQEPQRRECNDEENVVCFGCGSSIEMVDEKPIYVPCVRCNQPFGNCCTSRSMETSIEFKCPSCIGILAHDEVLKLSLEPIAERVDSITKQSSREWGSKTTKKAASDIRLMDDFARIHNSLHDSCQWELEEKHRALMIQMTRFQIDNGLDPSEGPFHLINLLGREGGPDLDLVNEACKMYVKHCLKRAEAENGHRKGKGAKKDKDAKQGAESEPKVRSLSSCQSHGKGLKIGFVSADFRATPLWQLFKVALLNIASIESVFVWSRPRIDLDGDPHFEALLQLATVEDFVEFTSDSTIADHIRKCGLDVLIDLGGPTLGSFTGVMALLRDELRGAFLGFAGTQPGGHIDFTVGDRFVLPPGGPQARMAQEALMLMHCYQPNDGFRCSVPIKNVEAARETTRSDWKLPEGKFVYAFFCRNGRISPCLIAMLVAIAKGAPNSFFWLRNALLFSVLRIKSFFRKEGLAPERLIFSPDVPGPQHRERIKHADLGLDSRFYNGHTTASDFLTSAVPYLVLKGGFFQSLVSYSLVTNMLGKEGDQLICSSPEEFQERAIHFATTGRGELEEIRAKLKSNLESHSGICDGVRWTRDFLRGLSYYVKDRKENPGGKLRNLILYEPISDEETAGQYIVLPQRERLLESGGMDVDESGADSSIGADSANPNATCAVSNSISSAKRSGESKGAGTCETEDGRAEKRSRLDGAESQVGNCIHDYMPSVGCANVEDPPFCLHSPRDQTLWLSHIKDLVKEGKSDQARAESLQFIQVDLPEGREIHCVKTADGQTIPAIQLPLQVDKISSETGKKRGHIQLRLLYVARGPHGLHLFSGEAFEENQHLTGYDGQFVADSSKIVDHTRVVSLSYSHRWAIDGGGVEEVVLVLKGSLGCMSNHAVDHASNARFAHKGCIAPISGCLQSCWLVARKNGEKHTEVLAHYTSGSADRHGIAPRNHVAGVNHIADKDLEEVLELVRACMDRVRVCSGYDLLKIHGSGAFGAAVQVSSGGQVFTIKFGKEQYDKDDRASVLVEAAMLSKAQMSKGGIFALQLHTGSGWPSGAALVAGLGQRIAAVSMQSANMDAHSIFADLGERFRVKAGDEGLLPDTKLILKAVSKTVKWMHMENMAHCDITPRNIFLMKLSCHPDDKRVAYFDYKGAIWQVVLGDWGHSRWDGENGGNRAVHRYSSAGKVHGHIPNLCGICTSTKFSEGVVPVGKRDLQRLYGLRTSKPSHFKVPGKGTILIRPPNQDDVEKFSSGEDQRKFDKASDVWAVGVLGARICAAPLVLSASQLCEAHKVTDKEYEKWPENLRDFSRRGSSAQVSKLAGSNRAGKAVDRIRQSTAECRDSWLAEMALQRYSDDAWPHLRRHMQGDDADEWLEFLRLLQGLLAYAVSDRLTAAEALDHQCFLNIGRCSESSAESDD